MEIKQRQDIERRIINVAVADLIAAGFFVAVHDGEAVCVPKTQDAEKVMAGIMTTDEDILFVYRNTTGGWIKHGWVQLVYGNTGHDVICDYTANLEDLMKGANDLSDKIAEEIGWV
jgi:hypothetical protein